MAGTRRIYPTEACIGLNADERDDEFSPKGRSETAVVPLLRHQGEMDSCGKDASGNMPS